MKKIYFWICLLVVVGFTIEIASRVLTHFVTIYDVEMAKYALSLKMDSSDASIRHVHMPNTSAKLMGVLVRINSDGLRGKDYPVAKEDGVYRIILLGDSLTLGWGVDEERTFGRALEYKFNRSSKVEILNFGVGNYNTEQEASLFLKKGVKYQPDEVLLMYFINDAEDMQPRSRLWFLAHSRFLTLIWSRSLAIRTHFNLSNRFNEYYANLYREDQVGWRRTKVSLSALSKYCLEHNIRFQVIILPEFHDLTGRLFREEYHKLECFLAANNIPYLNIAPFFHKFQDPHQFWVAKDDAHPNEKAHQLIADYLFDCLKKDIK